MLGALPLSSCGTEDWDEEREPEIEAATVAMAGKQTASTPRVLSSSPRLPAPQSLLPHCSARYSPPLALEFLGTRKMAAARI